VDELRALIPGSTTAQFTAQALRERFDQFVQETYTLIPAAATAFASHDWRTLGEVTARSQHAAETWLGNQVPETIALVSLAREHGAIAASAFGAGFGGSVWALVDAAGAAAFERAWAEAYRERFPEAASRAMFFTTESGPPAAHWADAPLAS
jgi:galactokinase